MNGNERHGMVIQERDRHLLRELSLIRVIDREQAKIIAEFGSTTRVNVRLLALTRAGLLRRFFLGTTAAGRKALYSLSAKGVSLVGAPPRNFQRKKDETLATDLFVQHQLAVNQVYCSFKYRALPPGVTFIRWLGFHQPLTQGLRLIPDGYLELGTPSSTIASFLELDRGTESLKVWKDKTRNYLQLALSGEFERRFHQTRFRVLVLATSDRRLLSIRAAVASLTEKIFWFSTLPLAHGAGFFQPLWLRPKGAQPVPLIEQPK
jgi:hypothetical protein